ncbi:MAG TPA: hypothetical protein VI916_07545 [Acidimicrobiia bacterium]|nr:hypothetical protein [Acidimicrobiia bacterium]
MFRSRLLDEITVVHAAGDPIHEQSSFTEVEDVTPPNIRSIGGAIHVLNRHE